MMKQVKMTCLTVIVFICLIFIVSLSEVKSAYNLIVDNNNGDISWESKEAAAVTGIRWQTKGYYLSLEPSDKLGYPLTRKSPMITLYRNDITVKVMTVEKHNGIYTVNNTVDGKYIKSQMLSNKAFYKKLIENYQKGNKTLYLDAFFETYEVVTAEEIRRAVISAYNKKKKKDFLKPNGKYVYLNNSKYDYDKKKDIVKKIRHDNLTNIDKIRNAEAWRPITKKQWHNKDYYNHDFQYEIYSNVRVKYVDKSGKLLKEVRTASGSVENPHNKFNSNEAYFASKITVDLPTELEAKKKGKYIKYRLVASEFYETGDAKKSINKKFGKGADKQKIVLGDDEALVVGTYEKTHIKVKDYTDEIYNELPEPEPIGVIGSGTLENSPFDIVDGIPTDEYYYKNVVTEEYLLKYRFKNKNGEKLYKVRSYITWHLSWVSGKGKNAVLHKAVRRRDYLTQVKRKYSYWYIDNLEVYTLDGAILHNKALPDTGIKMIPNGYIRPKIEYMADISEIAHLKPPPESLKIINLGARHVNGSSIPPYDPQNEIETVVGDVLVKNDSLSIDGKVIMDGKEVRKETTVPIKPTAKGKKTEKKVLYEFGNKIESTTQNNLYDSSGQVMYVLTNSINPEGDNNLEFDIEGVNQVIVHTPVICDYNILDAKKWCQLINPDKSLYQLVLEKGFDVEILTIGSHLDIKGYGKREYGKYVQKKEIIFPFDVLVGGNLHAANEPIEVSGNTHFRLPMTVDEGKYVILIRTFAINCLNEQDEEYYANLSRENYVAENRIGVEVSGRLIDFTLKDVKNTKMWENDNGSFAIGNGIRLNKLPLVEGDNPKFKNEGAFKKGYAVRYELTTIGNYYNEIYGIMMDFDFYVINSVTGERKPVDVYYEEVSEKEDRILGLIRIGSKKDKNNIHYIKNGDKKIGLFRYDRAMLPRQLLAIGSNRYIQRWGGEYSLPERIYVCEKGFNLEDYLKKHMSIQFDENFWIKSGQLVVTTDISTLKGGTKILSYINEKNEADGYFNNWKYETAGRRKYTAGVGELKFIDGDLFVYDLSKKIWQERRAEVKKVY
ncbi:MAG: DUF5704 domain-containing protein [Catonella sp.]|uniref:DUF5704 domain-containing protein n=1 Tax=Catonella sp. TaxID=2382125 RepID=UPI003FA022BB